MAGLILTPPKRKTLHRQECLCHFSEAIAESELDHSGSGIVGRIDVAEGAPGLTQTGVHRDIAGAVWDQEEVHQIERVQGLGAKLDILFLSDARVLDHA